MRRPAILKPREAHKMCGLLPNDSLGLFSGSIDTLACALLERMYYCKVGDQFVEPPPVKSSDVRKHLSPLIAEFTTAIPSFTPVSYDSFVDMYKGPKKEIYRRAVESLMEVDVCAQDAVAKAFVKREKCNVNKAPRVIQPRNPRYGAALGCYIKPFEKTLYGALQTLVGRGPVVTKGLNLDGVGMLISEKWHAFTDPVAVGLDATKFDMHCSKQILQFEHSVYNAIFKDPRLKKLLRMQLVNKGVGFAPDGKLKYTVEGRRLSGDMNTSCGNCLIMCSLVIVYCRNLNITYDLVNNGDDCVVFMERCDLIKFQSELVQWFFKFGYRIVCEDPVYILEHVEFCQMHPILVDGNYRMVRNPRVAIEKDTFCVTTLQHGRKYRDWATGVGIGGQAGCSGIPVLYSFYSYLNMGGTVHHTLLENTGMSRLQRGMVDQHKGVSDESRYSFYLAFGISPDAQIELERWFDTAQFEDKLTIDRYNGYLLI
nr:MAG: RNA-dependent RNA polymerase [Riboviria sp.]